MVISVLSSKYKRKCTQDAFSETKGGKKRKSNEASKLAEHREDHNAVDVLTRHDDDVGGQTYGTD
jgi:hypothetical protein